MGDGIYVALSGAIAQSQSLDATAQNLANASTDGYQRVRPVFREELARAAQTDGFHYAQIADSQNDPTRGPIRETGRPTDFSMPEGTYLAVTTSRGERYTRAASLTVGVDRTLRTAHGDAVLTEDGRTIKIPDDPSSPLRLDNTGQLYQGDEIRGRLKLVSFPSPGMLQHDTGALLSATTEAGKPAASQGPIEVGTLEESNANVVTAMTDLVQASRTFEAFQRVIDTFRDADRSVVTTVPGVGG